MKCEYCQTNSKEERCPSCGAPRRVSEEYWEKKSPGFWHETDNARFPRFWVTPIEEETRLWLRDEISHFTYDYVSQIVT